MQIASIVVLALVSVADAAYATINYWPEQNDCTGRMESLEINGDSCNTGNVILSYKYTGSSGAESGSSLNFYVDGSGCVGSEGSSYGFDADGPPDDTCYKPSPGCGSVSFFV